MQILPLLCVSLFMAEQFHFNEGVRVVISANFCLSNVYSVLASTVLLKSVSFLLKAVTFLLSAKQAWLYVRFCTLAIIFIDSF